MKLVTSSISATTIWLLTICRNKTWNLNACILIVLLASCSNKPADDYTSSMYKVYTASSGGRQYIFHLHRMYDSSEMIQYSGSYYNTVDQIPYFFSSDRFDSDSAHPEKIFLKTIKDKDSAYYFRITISADGKQLNGWLLRGTMKNWDAKITDSSAFLAKEDQDARLFTYEAAGGTAEMFDKALNSPQYNYKAGWLQPSGTMNPATARTINQCFSKVLKIPDTSTNPLTYIIENGKKKYFFNFKDKSEKDFLDSNGTKDSYDEDNRTEVVFSNKKWTSLLYFNSYYESGMMHPQSYKSYYVFDLQKGTRLILSDIIKQSSYSRVKEILVRNLKKQKGLIPTRTCLTNTNKSPLSDFYITETGIFFHFNPYQIASFAEGDIDVFVPFSELSDDLSTNFSI